MDIPTQVVMNQTFSPVPTSVSEMAFASLDVVNCTLDHMNQTLDEVTYADDSLLAFLPRSAHPPLLPNSTEWYNQTLRLWNEGDVNVTCRQFFVIVDKIPEDVEFVRWLIYVILFPTVALIGAIGNFINLLVLRRFKHRTYVYLYWLAVSDLLTMFLDFLVPWRVLEAPVVENWAYFFCNVTPATTGWLVATSSYMVLVITVERFYAVCFPMQSRTNSGGMNPTVVSFACLVLGFITFYPSRHILMTQTVGLQTEEGFTPTCYVCKYVKVDGFLYVYYKIRGTLTRTVPTIIVAFLNTCTIIGLRRHQHNRSSTLNQQPGPQEQAEDRIKLIIMSITTIFVLCYTPTCIKDVFAPPNGKSSLWYETFRLGALLLLHVNTACNFYVYCMCSPAIRQELLKVFRAGFLRGSRWSLKSQSTNQTSSTSNGGSIPESSKPQGRN